MVLSCVISVIDSLDGEMYLPQRYINLTKQVTIQQPIPTRSGLDDLHSSEYYLIFVVARRR